MEHDRAGRLGSVDRVDGAARLGRTGITRRRHHHGQRGGLRKGRRRDFGQPPLGHRQHHCQQVTLETQHQHLAFGIAEPGVIFDQLGALRRQHQPGIEHAGEGRPLGAQRVDRRPHDPVDRLLLQLGSQDARGAVGAHAAGIGAGIAVADTLVILRRAEGQEGLAIGQDEQARFLTLQEFLDDDFGTRHREQVGDRALGLGLGEGNGHALARRQAIGLDDDGQAEGRRQRGLRLRQRAHPNITGGRDVGAAAQVLGKALRALQLRGGLARPEHRYALGPERIGQAVDQRRFRANHDQAHAMLLHECHDGGVIGRVQRDAGRMRGDTGVAGRGVERI